MTPFAKMISCRLKLIYTEARRWSHIRFSVPYLRAHIRPRGSENGRMTTIPIVNIVKLFDQQELCNDSC